jgi:hypothetical protein
VRRFTADVVIDGIELFESMREWLLFRDPRADTKEMDETIRLARERKTLEGTTAKKHIEVLEIADEVGMTEDHTHTSKLCTKLLHQTA